MRGRRGGERPRRGARRLASLREAPRRKKWRSDKRRQGVPLEDDDEKEQDVAKPTPRAAGQTAMPRVPSMPWLNTSARLRRRSAAVEDAGEAPAAARLLDAEDEDRTVVQSRVEADVL